MSVKAAEKVGPTGKVLAIEPVAENAKFIRKHADINNLSIDVIEGAVTTSGEEAIQFFMTNNQANSVIRENLSGNVNAHDVSNISIERLRRIIDQTEIDRVVMSITTNGTEIDLLAAMVNCMQGERLKHVEIIIPIIYTNDKAESLKKSLECAGAQILVQYPWLRVIFCDESVG